MRMLEMFSPRTGSSASTAGSPKGEPPPFEKAEGRRQKARSAGLDPNYWYPVDYDARVAPGDVREISFWGSSYALFRDANGELHVVENRCAHRQLRLSVGRVEGCNLVCAYHGWQYDGEGRVVSISHDLFDRGMPRIKVSCKSVKVRYGLIWVFFGDQERASECDVPAIPELTGSDQWPCVPIDFTWKAHHSIIIDNVSDFTHAYLHRKYQPFSDAKLTECRTEGDKVFVNYDAKIGQGPIYQRLVNHSGMNSNRMELCYEYPFQWSNTDNRIKHHCFVLPVDRTTTRCFFLFYYDPRTFKVPFLPVTIPKRLLLPLLTAGNALLVRPLLAEDGFAVEEEQRGYDHHFDAPMMELNPAINAFQNLTIRKWDEHLASGNVRKRSSRTRAAAAP
ncbi:MAG TPA: aromatic ring-hydroxylating dioxygenase subunit alpha [Polyangiaceae bacterium]|nr:aromatic ring-hydroxylating dioxygenase subunit alpha [Polyangiaceae bacterium]